MRDEDFRAVLVVAGAQGSRDFFARDQTESESVAGGFVFRRVGLEIIPEVVSERVFLRDFGVEDGFELRSFLWELRELEMAAFAEADEEDAFTVLRHEALRINHLMIDGVFEVVGERVPDDAEGVALVVAFQVLHVLQHEGVGPVEVDQLGEFEEEVALFLVLESVFLAEAEFLGDARDAEGLAGKAGAEDMVRRDGVVRHGVDVAVRFFPEVFRVGDLRLRIPVGGEDALAAGFLKRDAEAANPAEEVDEFQR